jgi:hypothetical protein
MKVAFLVITILLMLGSGLGFIICLILPGVTRNVSVQEAMLVAIPLAILCFISFLGVIVSGILVVRGRKKAS